MRDFKKGNRFGGGHTGGGFTKGGFRGAPKRDFSSSPTELHQATCAHCNKACEVPFRPNGKKPVFCRDCFAAGKTEGSSRSLVSAQSTARAPFRGDSNSAHSEGDLQAQIAQLNTKLDTLVRMVSALNK